MRVLGPKVIRAVVVAAAALLLVSGPAAAFSSIQVGKSPHDDITAVAATLGWPEDAVKALQAAVRQPDISDLQPAPVEGDKARVDVSATFRPWHHCDRVAPTTDAEAVDATIAYVAHERSLAHELALLDPEASVRALGRALHALQDCFSHTDVVDLAPEDQRALADALVHTGLAPRLRVCGSQPGAPDIGRPDGDAYPHADFNKDDAKSTPEAQLPLADGRSKFEHALGLATNATEAFLVDFMGDLDAVETAHVLGIQPVKEARHDALGISALGGAWAFAAVATAAFLCPPRRDGPA